MPINAFTNAIRAYISKSVFVGFCKVCFPFKRAFAQGGSHNQLAIRRNVVIRVLQKCNQVSQAIAVFCRSFCAMTLHSQNLPAKVTLSRLGLLGRAMIKLEPKYSHTRDFTMNKGMVTMSSQRTERGSRDLNVQPTEWILCRCSANRKGF